MDFGVLGPLEVRSPDRDMAIGSRRQRRLLTALLVHAGTALSNDRLVAAVWGDDPPATAVQSLYTYISRLRAFLRTADDDDILVTHPPGYLLRVAPEQTDAGRFERLLAEARAATGDPELALARLDEALALWRGSAYAEFADAEFARSEAMRLDELKLAAIEERFDAGLALGRHADLVGAIDAYAADHPLRERPRGQLMLSLYRCGRHAEALAVFRAYRDRLDTELGMQPSTALRSLESTVLRQGSELDWAPPVPSPSRETPAPSRPHGGVPGDASTLIGRERDVVAVTAALADSRLVTLTGVGGVGKTRLAAQAGAKSDYPDGVWWCELAPVNDGAAVVHAVAATVGAKQQRNWSIEQSLLAFLSTKQLLLIVDNCEHVLDAIAPLLESVLRACPQVTLLATSRVGLGVTGERIRPTAPLPVPAGDSDAASTPAVRLFVDRARAVRPDLDLTEENITHIAEVCRRLDGLPLGIELAAARIRALNPVDLAARTRNRFDLLTTSRRTVIPRHRTLRAVVDWSYTLLSPDEQRLFGELSVFAGGFTLAAAERVCRGTAVVDLLAVLVDNSLVTAGSTAGQVRYSMLETLRAYGHELLEHRGELHTLRDAHASYFTAHSDEARRGMRGPDEGHWISVLDADRDNLRAAHRWSVERQDTDLALRLSAGLYHYASYRFDDEIVSWGETALDLPDASSHPRYPAVCGAVGEGLTLRGDLRRALSLAEKALATDPADRDRIPPLKVITAVALYEGRLDDCFASAQEQLRLARLHDNTWYELEALLFQGLARTYAGDPAGGLVIADENLRGAEAIGNPTHMSWALYNQAEALSRADPDRARPLYERSIAVAESVSSTFAATIAQVGLAALLTRSGDPDDALRAFHHCVTRWHRMQVWHHQWTTLRGLAQLLVRMSAHEEAAVLLGAMGSADSAAYGADADSLADADDALREALGASAFAAATTRGTTMTADATVAFALAAIDRVLRGRASESA